MKIIKSHNVQIWVGLREKYSDIIHSIDEVESLCQKWCDTFGACFTVTETTFIYTNGKEKGCVIGLINYPRFPKTEYEIEYDAVKFAMRCLIAFNQNRITVTTPKVSIMIENEVKIK